TTIDLAEIIEDFMKQYGTGALLGAILMLPVVGFLSLMHEIIGHAHLPVELIHSTFGLAATNIVLLAEQGFMVIPYYLWGVFVTMLAHVHYQRRGTVVSLKSKFMVVFVISLPLLLVTGLFAPTWGQSLIAMFGVLLLFSGWVLLEHALYDYMRRHHALLGTAPSEPEIEPVNHSRRNILLGLGALGVTLFGGIGGSILHSNRRSTLATKANIPDHFPSTLTAKFYQTQLANFQFPEQLLARYQPTSHPLGVCFSGGGPRAMSCAMGQMRGLHTLGLIDSIGTVSAVSGGGWFSTLFTYAPIEIDDETLLGSIVEPEAITLENLATIDPRTIAAPLINMSDEDLLIHARDSLRTLVLSDTQAFNRFYARLLNESLLKPFGLDHPHKFFTMDEASVQQIVSHNPTLQASQFYTARPNRPFLICGATHIYPPGPDRILRPFEYSSMYSGMFQFFPQAGDRQTDLGGGYVENLAFDSTTPLDVPDTGLVTVSTPEPIFLLSDMMGSTSSGPDIILDYYSHPELLPAFRTWSQGNPDQPSTYPYDLYDGSNIENIGIIPLLRRQYPVIFAFVNTSVPLGSDHPDSVDGLVTQISRLFGRPTAFQAANFDSTQIFPKEQFPPLAEGLKAARQAGNLAMYVDSYQIMQPNLFDLPPYPNDQKVTVVWFYNDLNENWHSKLSPEVQTLLTSTDPTNRMDNFPFFGTINQNKTDEGIPQFLYYSAEQINLLAHMWSYNISQEAKDVLLKLSQNPV
ncbi:hypothetical protein QUF63_15915, partial [Anaerolineales bacterium HSG25]|nr:hypothetical protein [Anaerolineales bacterium HSG25]